MEWLQTAVLLFKAALVATFCNAACVLYIFFMRYSAFAGSLAALGGILGKLGADTESSALQYIDAQCHLSALSPFCPSLSYSIRLFSFVLMLSVNGLMLHYFVQGLHETDSLTATVTSAAVNFILSAASGSFIFHENLHFRWFLGATIILIGMAFLLHGTQKVKIY